MTEGIAYVRGLHHLGHMARVTLLPVALACGLLTGCVASASDTEPEDDSVAAGEATVKTESVGLTTTNGAGGPNSAAATNGLPAAPAPTSPQPSPWRPNGPSLQSSPGASPTATPQPSPWQGHGPSDPSNVTTASVTTTQ